MENSTNIDNLKNDNSTEINSIIDQIQQDNSTVQQDNNMVQKDININSPDEFVENNSSMDKNESIEIDASITDILIHEFKGMITFIILFVILSLNNLDELMGTYLSFVMNDDYRLNFLGISLKGILGGIIFYILNKFIL